ncbi:MAG: nucleotidyl transferase AbiEii/AbiGii toxin family protein [Candidatus Gracilibacteria bacterium]|nr:nucleotidyl transferase AbiEii/AbiGii toxin family protein [Candidatus Gracilibacteria bacterium]
MYNIVLDKNQISLLPLLKTFQKDFYLVGGTAMALNLYHRKSIDFDLFSKKEIKQNSIINNIIKLGYKIEHTLVNNKDELTVIISGVKVTFLYFPFEIDSSDFLIDEIIKAPDLLTLASMKAYAIGRRSKWKDYVDMYFLLKNGYSIENISEKANSIFGGAFEEKLFRQQLCYFDDIDYTEQVEYIGENIDDTEIKKYLYDIAVSL